MAQLSPENSSYRYGDGLFETIRCKEGKLLMQERHFQRLFEGMQLLGYQLPAFFNRIQLAQNVEELLKKNKYMQLARIRISVYRGLGGLFDNDGHAGYLIEAWALEPQTADWNEEGWVIGIYPDARKATDRFSHLKSASFLPYSMAAHYAKENNWDDALVLNTSAAIADSSMANIFLVQNGKITTPSLNQGCVAGTFRASLLEKLREHHYPVEECTLRPAQLEDADEVFLTNAIRGIRWVRTAGSKVYSHVLTKEIFERFA